MSEKTHWRKNRNPKFLNGEDLKYGLIKDVHDGMAVQISGVNVTESFDPNTQAETQVVELKFNSLSGKPISKGVVPGKWAFDFMKYNGIKSPFCDDWIGKKLLIYAKADNRFGHVVRFKRYVETFDATPYTGKMKACKTLEELTKCYTGFEASIKKQPSIIKCKDELKASYESN